MKHLFFLILLLILSIEGSNGQTKSIRKSLILTEGAPESVGMSAERLARIDSLCVRSVKNGDIPGVVSLIVR